MPVLEWSRAILPRRDDLKDWIGGLFRRTEPSRQVGLYLDGLIGWLVGQEEWMAVGLFRLQ
jgi:hypothetical protein